MGLEERVRRMKRPARNSFYRWYADYGIPQGARVTNWRMLIAQRLSIPISRVREILGEPPVERQKHRDY